jgi:hypothetical protein
MPDGYWRSGVESVKQAGSLHCYDVDDSLIPLEKMLRRWHLAPAGSRTAFFLRVASRLFQIAHRLHERLSRTVLYQVSYRNINQFINQ